GRKGGFFLRQRAKPFLRPRAGKGSDDEGHLPSRRDLPALILLVEFRDLEVLKGYGLESPA
ncbi:hypothetical protein Taro_036666, partial [Colocasia esculenta]|nr:hypothetical protein [Colocasia esculenta]